MINKDKLELNVRKYYTPNWSGSAKIMVLKILDNGLLLVQASKGEPFVRPIAYVFNDETHVNRSRRDWESSERRRKKNKKK
jgi:hypothetical protein